MRRVLAILLLLIVPFQFAWSAVESMHANLNHQESAAVFHSHDADHRHDTDVDRYDSTTDGLLPQGHNDDGHHDGHYHPVFGDVVLEPPLSRVKALPQDPPWQAASSFTSHIPSPFDWPPSSVLL